MSNSRKAMATAFLSVAALSALAIAACHEAASVEPSAVAVSGSGTPSRVAMWDSSTVLGNAPIKVDSAGNIILQTAGAVYIRVGTRCFRFDSAGMATNAPGCPGL